jgi:hypothetical protein
MVLLLLLPLRLRDFDRPLRLRLLEGVNDLRADDPREEEEDLLLLRLAEEEEILEPTDRSILPLIDAGDLGGRRFDAIICLLEECIDGDDEDRTVFEFIGASFDESGTRRGLEYEPVFGVIIVILVEFIVAYLFVCSLYWTRSKQHL